MLVWPGTLHWPPSGRSAGRACPLRRICRETEAEQMSGCTTFCSNLAGSVAISSTVPHDPPCPPVLLRGRCRSLSGKQIEELRKRRTLQDGRRHLERTPCASLPREMHAQVRSEAPCHAPAGRADQRLRESAESAQRVRGTQRTRARSRRMEPGTELVPERRGEQAPERGQACEDHAWQEEASTRHPALDWPEIHHGARNGNPERVPPWKRHRSQKQKKTRVALRKGCWSGEVGRGQRVLRRR